MASGGNVSKREFWEERYVALGGSLQDVSPRQAIRINTLRTKPDALLTRLRKRGIQLQKIQYSTNGHWITQSTVPIGAITEHLLGYYYMQGDAAQLPVEVLAPKAGELVLDCCAAPGGKATQIIQMMQNKGLVIALERKEQRIPALLSNLERCGCHNVVAYHLDARKVDKLGLQFDRILLDAPCSGNYVSEKRWFNKRTLQDIKVSARIQKRLLECAIAVLKPGGTLVYSTCSLEPEENELNMQWLLDQGLPVRFEKIHLHAGGPGLTKVFDRVLATDIAGTKRFWPTKTGTEGFYIAKLVKT